MQPMRRPHLKGLPENQEVLLFDVIGCGLSHLIQGVPDLVPGQTEGGVQGGAQLPQSQGESLEGGGDVIKITKTKQMLNFIYLCVSLESKFAPLRLHRT